MGDDIFALVFLQDLEVVTTTGAAAAEGKNVLFWIIDGKMNQTVFICLIQDSPGLFDGDQLRLSRFDHPVGHVVHHETHIDRIIASLDGSPAGAISQGKNPRIPQDLNGLGGRQDPLPGFQSFFHGYDPGREGNFSLFYLFVDLFQAFFQLFCQGCRVHFICLLFLLASRAGCAG